MSSQLERNSEQTGRNDVLPAESGAQFHRASDIISFGQGGPSRQIKEFKRNVRVSTFYRTEFRKRYLLSNMRNCEPSIVCRVLSRGFDPIRRFVFRHISRVYVEKTLLSRVKCDIKHGRYDDVLNCIKTRVRYDIEHGRYWKVVKFLKLRPIYKYDIASLVELGCFENIRLATYPHPLKIAIRDLMGHCECMAQMNSKCDILGTHHLADSIGMIAKEAVKLHSTIDTNASACREHMDRLSNVVMSSVTTLLPEFSKVIDTFAKTNETVNKAVDTGEGLLSRFSSFMKVFDNPLTANIYFCLIYLTLEIAERQFDVPNLFVPKVLFGLYALYKVGSSAVSFVSKWIVDLVSENFAPQSWDEWAKVAVQGVIFVTFGTTLDTSTLRNSVKSLCSCVGDCSKLNDAFTAIIEWFKGVGVLVCETFGIEAWDCLKPTDAVAAEFMHAIHELNQKYQDDPMAINVDFLEKVTKLSLKVNDYLSQIPKTPKNHQLIVMISKVQDKIFNLERIAHENGMNFGERTRSVLVAIAGASSIGKTYFNAFASRKMAFAFAETAAEIAEIERNPAKHVYDMPTEIKHLDTYCGQTVCNFADGYCTTDAEGQPSEASMLIHMVGDQPCPLPAAELSKKMRLWFISKVIFMQTNLLNLGTARFKSVRNLDALSNRMDEFGWYMSVKPAFIQRNAEGIPIFDIHTNRVTGHENDFDLYGKLNKELALQQPDPLDVYHFRRFKFSTGSFVDDRIYDYHGFLELCKRHCVSVHREGLNKRNQLKNFSTQVAREAINNLHGNANHGEVPFIRMANVVQPFPLDDMSDVDSVGSGFEPQMNRDITIGNRHIFGARLQPAEEVRVISKALEVGHPMLSLPQMAIYAVRHTMTREEHQRVHQIVTHYINGFDNIAMSGSAFQALVTRQHFGEEEHEIMGMCYTVLLRIAHDCDVDPLARNVSQTLDIIDIVRIAYMDYESAKECIFSMQCRRYVKNPVVSALNEVGNALHFIFDSTRNMLSTIRSGAIDAMHWLFGPNIDRMWREFLAGISVSAGIMIPMAVFVMGCHYTARKHTAKTNSEIRANLRAEREILKWRHDMASKEGQMSLADHSSMKQTIDKYIDNNCLLYVDRHNGKVVTTNHLCNVLFLGGRVAIIVNHAHKQLEALMKMCSLPTSDKRHIDYVVLRVVPFIHRTSENCTENCRLESVLMETSDVLEKHDLSIITFPIGRNRPDIYKLIPPKQCVEYMVSGKSNIEGVFIERTTNMDQEPTGPETRHDVFYNLTAMDVKYSAYDMTYGDREHTLGLWEYQALQMRGQNREVRTYAGYCGCVGYVTDERKNFCVNLGWPQAQQPWMMYYHASSQGVIPHGTLLVRECFEPWIERLKVKTVPIVDGINENLRVYADAIKEEIGLEAVGQMNDFLLSTELKVIDDNHTSLGVCNHNFYVPKKSEIVSSPLPKKHKLTRFPARLYNFTRKDGVFVDVVRNAREPYGSNSVVLNNVLVEGIIEKAMERVYADSDAPRCRDLLTLEQCLFGDSAFNLVGVNWDSSCGFYLRMMKDLFKQQWKAKKWMLTDESLRNNKIELKGPVHRLVKRLFDYYDKRLQSGYRVYGINIDNIKDELLPLEKVVAGNSRLFCACDFIVLLLCKKYMGAFAGWIYDNRVKNGIAIGVNPYSLEWNAIANKLMSTSNDMLFMDHSKYDKHQIRQIMGCILVLMDKFYCDAGSNASNIRSILFEDIVNSIHVYSDVGKQVFYTWDQGNTSGNFLTAILNSLVNWCYMYICCAYCWLICQGVDPNKLTVLPDIPIDRGMSLMCLGDDVVMAINQKLLRGVNFNTVVAVAQKYLGIKITDELKSGGDIPNFRRLEEGSFLGRQFKLINFDCVDRWIAPLRMHSVLERMHWIKGVFDPEIEVEKMASVNLELALHGPEVFKMYSEEYSSACVQCYHLPVKHRNFSEALRCVLTMAEYRYTFGVEIPDDEARVWSGPSFFKLLERVKMEECINEPRPRFIAKVDAGLTLEGKKDETNVPGDGTPQGRDLACGFIAEFLL